MVKNLATKNRIGWDCPEDVPISECPVVKQWYELIISLLFSEGAGFEFCLY